MGGETSEQGMEPLKEVALFKELDKVHEANPNQAEHEASRARQHRHGAITAQIKALAKQEQGCRNRTRLMLSKLVTVHGLSES